MIKVIRGDLLSVESGIIAHGCNAKGVMGGGVALAIRKKYPQVFNEYRDTFIKSGLRLGEASAIRVSDDLTIWNLITQSSYGSDGRRFVNYAAIAKSFCMMMEKVDQDAVISIPSIGAGLGGGDINVILDIIRDCAEMSSRYDVSFNLYCL